ncbi:MAG: 4-hydroxy-tetrahydrodipicolinate synthase [Bdellovibrionaceae bacterium]|nr:4-hydroxy-tetrahydrodipicolinate synthase [Pseudobdellovibrionaceae bacterium]MBX3033692.1 4-hydroxy-tetrahydrodipicolinate synthase [Pseudobdellovibrionaceae bacterium]
MNNLKATITALITPFHEGKIDYDSLERLLDHQLKNGIEGFVINGTTAESPTLEKSEREEIFRFARQFTQGRVPLIMGTGSNSTEKTVQATREAEKLGADAVLVVVPYYNKPPQRGLFAHFKKTAESTSLPVLLYNVPGRTITSLAVETVQELSRIKNIVGIKEASGKIDLARDIQNACGREFILLSGDDGTYAEFLAAGGHGVISVASHILPAAFSSWRRSALEGKFEEAREGIRRYGRLIDLLFCEANPIPVKKALQLMGLVRSAELRLPLTEMESALTAELKKEMTACGLLK